MDEGRINNLYTGPSPLPPMAFLLQLDYILRHQSMYLIRDEPTHLGASEYFGWSRTGLTLFKAPRILVSEPILRPRYRRSTTLRYVQRRLLFVSVWSQTIEPFFPTTSPLPPFHLFTSNGK